MVKTIPYGMNQSQYESIAGSQTNGTDIDSDPPKRWEYIL